MVKDIAVIGAGIIGSAAGKYLAEAGEEVAIVGPSEPEELNSANAAEFGAFFDEARITRQLGWDPVWSALDAASQARFEHIETQSGTKVFHKVGSLILISGRLHEKTEAIAEQAERNGVYVEILGLQDLERRFPNLAFPPLAEGTYGVLEPREAGYLNPRALVKAQLSLARAAGSEVWHTTARSLSWSALDSVWEIDAGPNVPLIQAKRVLLATGAFTNHLGLLPKGCRLDIRAFAEPNLMFELTEDQATKFSDLPAIVTVDPEDSGNGNMTAYLVPPIRYSNGRIYMRIGPGMQPCVHELPGLEDMMQWFQAQCLTQEQRALLERIFAQLVPLAHPISVSEKTCIVDKTATGYPYLGEVPDTSGLFVAVGGNGHGARGSDEIGRLVAQIACRSAWSSPLPSDLFAPQFERSAEVQGEYAAQLQPPFALC